MLAPTKIVFSEKRGPIAHTTAVSVFFNRHSLAHALPPQLVHI